MNFGKCISRNGQLYIRDDETKGLYMVRENQAAVAGERYSFEINEDDDAFELQLEAEAMRDALGVDLNTISFYRTIEDEEAETHFGTCDLTGVRGDLVPCIGLATDGSGVVQFEVGTWIVHSTLGRYAGAF